MLPTLSKLALISVASIALGTEPWALCQFYFCQLPRPENQPTFAFSSLEWRLYHLRPPSGPSRLQYALPAADPSFCRASPPPRPRPRGPVIDGAAHTGQAQQPAIRRQTGRRPRERLQCCRQQRSSSGPRVFGLNADCFVPSCLTTWVSAACVRRLRPGSGSSPAFDRAVWTAALTHSMSVCVWSGASCISHLVFCKLCPNKW